MATSAPDGRAPGCSGQQYLLGINWGRDRALEAPRPKHGQDKDVTGRLQANNSGAHYIPLLCQHLHHRHRQPGPLPQQGRHVADV